jgi:arginyl-tRNA--protein-N-Asp/Glu arginylyltransferase
MNFYVHFPVKEHIMEIINNQKARYLDSKFKSIQNIHRIFIDMFAEHKYDVKYRLFRELFIKSGLINGKPKCEICSVCDGFQI